MAMWGRHLHKREVSEGKEPKAANLFVLVMCSFGAAGIFAIGGKNPFLYFLFINLLGGFIGVGTAYFALRFVSGLRRGQSQRPEERR